MKAELELGRSEDIPEGGARGFELRGRRVLGVKERGRIHLYLNRCPHLGIPLEWAPHEFLDADGALIRCANHGALFAKDSGECIAGPCRGEYLWSISHRLEDGRILVPEDELPPPANSGGEFARG